MITSTNVLDGALRAAQQGYLALRIAAADIARLTRDFEGVDAALRLVEDSTKLANVLSRTQNVASTFLDRIDRTRNLFRICRLANSFNYIASGQLYRDVVEKKALPLVTQGAFLLGRAIVTVHIFVKQGVLTWESLALKAAKIGGVKAFNLVNALQKPQVANWCYLIALSGLMVPEVQSIRNGDAERDVHTLNAVSLAFDIGIIALELLDFENTAARFGMRVAAKAALLTMGAVAGGTALWASFASPSNYVA